jgi:enolase
VVIGMDVAASEFFSDKDKTYDLNFKEDVRTATYYALLRALFFMLLYRPMIINDYLS